MGFFDSVGKFVKTIGKNVATGADWVVNKAKGIGKAVSSGVNTVGNIYDDIKNIPYLGEVLEHTGVTPLIDGVIGQAKHYTEDFKKAVGIADTINKGVQDAFTKAR